MIVTLSRPKRVAATPTATPSCTPGFSAGGTSGPQARSICCAVSRRRLTSRPIAAAGTKPNFDSTE